MLKILSNLIFENFKICDILARAVSFYPADANMLSTCSSNFKLQSMVNPNIFSDAVSQILESPTLTHEC